MTTPTSQLTWNKIRPSTRPTPPAPPGAAGLYLRISDDAEGLELGITRQDEDCVALTHHHGVPIVARYADNDVGASTRTRKPRPQFKRLLNDVKAGRVTTIVAYTTSRLTRRPMELEDLITLYETTGVRFMFVRSPNFDLNTADGRLVARMLAANDAAEVERIAERVSREARQRAERGQFHGGPRPYGYEPDGLTIRPAEAAIVVHMAEQVLAGVPLRQIARDLTDANIPTGTPGPWNSVKVRKILLRPRNAGISISNGMEVGALRGDTPPILDEGLWRSCVARLTDPTRVNNPGRASAHLGATLYHCDCGRLVTTRTKPAVTYVCRDRRPGQRHTTVRVATADIYVRDAVLDFLANRNVADVITPPASDGADINALRIKLRHLDDAEDDLTAEFTDTMGGDPRLRDNAKRRLAKARARITAQRATILTALAAHEAGSSMVAVDELLARLANSPDMGEAWDALPLGARRAVVDTLMTVTIPPAVDRQAARRPSPVTIEWKFATGLVD